MALYKRVHGSLVKINDAAQEWDRLDPREKADIFRRAFTTGYVVESGVAKKSWSEMSSDEQGKIMGVW